MLESGDQDRSKQAGESDVACIKISADEVYGRYAEGLEQNRLKILAYFDRDIKQAG